ncbi:MAG: nicotinate-nucleotide pyrophosphorylase (carboxylating) [Planctomycetota bacterium]
MIDDVVRMALREDLGAGDVTSETSVPEAAIARANLIAKASGVMAGMQVFLRAFRQCDPDAELHAYVQDGEAIEAGALLASVHGNARALLLAERTALNLMQRMCGIATRTRRLVDRVHATGSAMHVLDTRKTTPGLRALEKYAVLCGGGHNHRFGLNDQVLLKENHIDLAGRPIRDILRGQREVLGDAMILTAEARDAEEAREAVIGGADVVLLDNMTPEQMSALAPELRALAQDRARPVLLEASGGIDESTIEAVARTGLDRVSIGALTHSVEALDLSLSLEPSSSLGSSFGTPPDNASGGAAL